MLRPFLLIGVGGSGGKTLRVVREDLRRRLEQAGWRGDMPRAWQFLQIDVPTYPDGNDPDLPEQLPMGDYQGLVAPGLTYRTIDSALAGIGRTAMGDALAGWRPDPGKVNVPVERGAGQYRALGRMIMVANLERVSDAVQRARRDMHGAEVTGELGDVTRHLGGQAMPSTADPSVVVVSSIAGGSGAGAVIDVCDAVRSLGDPWASESVGILFAPDVFDYLPEERRKGVRPNALATICELLAAYLNKDGPSEATAMLLSRHGVQLGAVDRLGPRYCFLVGARNEHVAFATQNDIYRAMGRSLASWVASEHVQDRMSAYVQGNWQPTAVGLPDKLPLKSSYMETPYSAIGSARAGLGRDRFLDYAAERLAYEAVARVLRRHEEIRATGDDRNERALVLETAEAAFGPFLQASGLDERGESNNAMLDALRPPDQKERLLSLSEDIVRQVTANTPGKGYDGRIWSSRILVRLREQEPAFLDAVQQGRRDQGRAWVRAMQDRLTLLAARSIAREGGPVTAELFGKLETELGQVREELIAESAKMRRWASEVDQFVEAEIRSAGSDTLPPLNPQIRQAAKRGVQALDWECEAQLRDLVVSLIPDVLENVVRPLGEAVARASQALGLEEVSQRDGRPSPISTWPKGSEVPLRLKPAANEFLIDPVDEYPAVFSNLVQRTLAADSPLGALREAVMQVVVGTEDLSTNRQQLARRTSDWTPRLSELHVGAAATPVRASFELDLKGDNLLARATEWILRTDTPMGRYVRDSLRDYLDPASCAPEQHARRLRAFESKFIAAFNAASPLVSINPAVLVQVHERSDAPADTFFTELPFPPKSPARALLQRVLEARGAWTEETERSLTDGTASSVDIFTVLREPYEPVVFDSLMRPIASEWGARQLTADLRSEFWRWRRARPLTEFIPVAPAIRRAMVRGWFTASYLGQLKFDGMRVTIFVPNDAGGPGTWLPFPNPLLVPDVPQAYDYLPAVLKSLPLALVQVSVEARLTAVDPYTRLRHLGKSGRGGEYEDYQDPTVELDRWIRSGALPTGAPTPEASITGSVDDDWVKRRDQAEARFASLKDRYATQLFQAVESRHDVFDVPRAWELRSDILQAFDDMSRALRRMDSPDTGDWG